MSEWAEKFLLWFYCIYLAMFGLLAFGLLLAFWGSIIYGIWILLQ